MNQGKPQKRNRNRSLQVNMPALVSTDGFKPTQLQQEFAIYYLSDKKGEFTPGDILRKIGCSAANWSLWLKKPGFTQWLQVVVAEYMSSTGLVNVHKSIYRNALGNSQPDRKLHLERFDPDYKPTTKTEIDLFPGHRPDAIERSRRRIEGMKQRDATTSPATGQESGFNKENIGQIGQDNRGERAEGG